MASEKDVLDRKKEMSDKISTQVRTLAVGIVAFAWGLIVSDSSFAKDLVGRLRWHLLAIGSISMLTIFFDFLQYSFGYELSHSTLRKMEREKETEGSYDYLDWRWIWQTRLFYIKQASLLLSTVYLLIAIVSYLVCSR